MNRKFFCLLMFILAGLYSFGQDKWSLERCVTYAVANNISVKQADVQARITALTLKLNQARQLPNLSFSTNSGYNFGRSINPATNQFESNKVFFSNYQFQSGVNLFNWFSQKYATQASKLDKMAADASVDKAKNDIALNVAVAYLQTLLAHERVETNRIAINQILSNLDVVQKRVAAGALPELNLIEMQAQLANDSAVYMGALSTYQQNLIQLKALLNLDMAISFEIETPNVTQIPLESLADLQPGYVYDQAKKNFPQQRMNQYRYQSSLQSIKEAKAAMYPTLSAFAGLGSTYSNLYSDRSRSVITPLPGFDTLGLLVQTAPGTFEPVLSPKYSTYVPYAGYSKQVFNINLGERIGLNLSIPIFNNRQLRTNWERAKLNSESIKLQLQQDDLSLQADIYNAYTTAVNAQQGYFAAIKAVESSQKAYDFSQKRYTAGLLSVFEFITNENNLNTAKLNALIAQYEYVFRMKLLEFYKGQGLKL